MVADDFEMHIGVCGKDGQGVPAGSGQPTLRMLNMTVGGTESMKVAGESRPDAQANLSSSLRWSVNAGKDRDA